MPYLKEQERRQKLDAILSLMKEIDVQPKGDLNYLLFAYAKRCIKPSYNAFKEFIGELECCKLEVYRELISPYEDLKRDENGRVE